MLEIKDDFKKVDDVTDLLKDLFDGREGIPFYNEEDFRFSFAHAVKNKANKFDVTLEFPRSDSNGWIDLVVWDQEKAVALFEFKYKTKASKTIKASHGVLLTKDSAQNDNRFRFFQDIEKLENENDSRFNGAQKYCIFLTNDAAYKKSPNGKKKTADRELRINDERDDLNTECEKILTYYKNPPKTITLKGKYTFNWKTYTGFGKEDPFYYLVVEVN